MSGAASDARLAAIDWTEVGADLDAQGWAVGRRHTLGIIFHDAA